MRRMIFRNLRIVEPGLCEAVEAYEDGVPSGTSYDVNQTCRYKD